MRTASSIVDVPRQHFIHWPAVLGVSVLAAVAVGVAMWPDAQASETGPSPTASATTAAAATLPDEGRYPQAPGFDATTWKQVDASWDLEVVAYAGGGSLMDPTGNLAAYLTPPGGERHLAFYVEGADPADLTALGWDPDSMLLLLGSSMTRTFAVADLHSGALTQLDPPGIDPERIKEIHGLGRGSDGRIYVSMLAKDDDGGVTLYLTSWAPNGWSAATPTGYTEMSRISGDTSVAIADGEVVTRDVVTGAESAPFENAADCTFLTWSTAADFTVGCDIEGEDIDINAIVGSYKSGNVTTHGPMLDLGATQLRQYHLVGGAAEIVVGTPLVASADAEDGTPGQLGIATTDGFRAVGSPQVELSRDTVTLAADTRWLIVDEARVPVVVDAARGTLSDLREDFQGTNLAFAFIPGDRS